jgi:hypothetical protein
MNRLDVPSPSSLLLVGCSRRKSAGMRRGRAWDLYDGPSFQVLKKALNSRVGWEHELAVLIVSAKYGVVRADRVIASYDEQLTPATVLARGDRFARQLRAAIAGYRFQSIHVNLGRLYLAALPDLDALFAPAPVDRASGGIGVRNSRMRRWVLDRLSVETVPLSDGTGGRQLCPP